MNHMILELAFRLKYVLVASSGFFLALVVWKMMTMDIRYLLAITGGILFLSVAMMGISHITDILVLAFIFNIPFTMFGKWLFAPPLGEGIHGVAAQGISVGMAELLILLAYATWFARIFVARIEPLPKLQKIDFFMLLLLAVQAISLIGAGDKRLGVFDIVYHLKHMLIYFFIAHNVKRRHLKWVVIIFCFAMLLETNVAFYEYLTENVGIGVTKGNVDNPNFGTQEAVLGIEEIARAAGTTDDPHTLGLYYSMVLPVPFVLLMMDFLRTRIRVILSGVFIIGVIGLVISFSRSGWLSFTLGTIFAMGVIVFSWKQAKAIPIVLILLLCLSLSYPNLYKFAYNRLFEAPIELMESRLNMARTALSLWGHHILFGCGTTNYYLGIQEPKVTIYGRGGDLQHNAFLTVASETGLSGVISFFGIIFIAIFRCWKVIKSEDLLIRGLALAVMTGFIAYLLDGITNFAFKQVVPYSQLWIYIALTISFNRLLQE